VPITVSPSALTGNSSVTVVVESKDFAISTNGLTVEVTPRG
jgi:3-deoxy-D-arabino-heptulosonate 7-phosphate (DAHP) synthase